jgi:folate-binding protein YgfZ
MTARLFDLSDYGKVEVAGKDAARFLHNLCTNEIVKLPPDAGCEAFLTTGQAKIVAYAFVFHSSLPERGGVYFLDAGPGMGEKVHRHLDHYLVSEQVELADRTGDLAQVHLAGPEAVAILESILQANVGNFAELQHVSQNISGSACHVRRISRLGMPGFDLLCPKEQKESLGKRLVSAGARPAGQEEFEILRIEAGTPVYGKDIDETNLPQEVNRVAATVSFTKGCYIGQETVARIRTYGHVNRSLVGLKLSEKTAIPPGAILLRDGKEAGKVTSSVVSTRLGTGIALGYVRRGNESIGTALQVGASDTILSAEVTRLPFTD